MCIHVPSLTRIRRQQSLSLRQVAIRARVLEMRLWLAERGYAVDADTADRIAAALNTTVEHLSGEPDHHLSVS